MYIYKYTHTYTHPYPSFLSMIIGKPTDVAIACKGKASFMSNPPGRVEQTTLVSRWILSALVSGNTPSVSCVATHTSAA